MAKDFAIINRRIHIIENFILSNLTVPHRFGASTTGSDCGQSESMLHVNRWQHFISICWLAGIGESRQQNPFCSHLIVIVQAALSIPSCRNESSFDRWKEPSPLAQVSSIYTVSLDWRSWDCSELPDSGILFREEKWKLSSWSREAWGLIGLIQLFREFFLPPNEKKNRSNKNCSETLKPDENFLKILWKIIGNFFKFYCYSCTVRTFGSFI